MKTTCILAALLLFGCARESVREEGFGLTDTGFLYSAHTNTVMTPNDDGVAEMLRRVWLVDAVKFHAMCADGYRIDSRHYVPDPVENGGDVLYEGRCL